CITSAWWGAGASAIVGLPVSVMRSLRGYSTPRAGTHGLGLFHHGSACGRPTSQASPALAPQPGAPAPAARRFRTRRWRAILPAARCGQRSPLIRCSPGEGNCYARHAGPLSYPLLVDAMRRCDLVLVFGL